MHLDPANDTVDGSIVREKVLKFIHFPAAADTRPEEGMGGLSLHLDYSSPVSRIGIVTLVGRESLAAKPIPFLFPFLRSLEELLNLQMEFFHLQILG